MTAWGLANVKTSIDHTNRFSMQAHYFASKTATKNPILAEDDLLVKTNFETGEVLPKRL